MGERALLAVTDLHAYYGKSHVLRGVSLEVGARECVGLLGRNGAGRSTLLRALFGEVAATGDVRLDGAALAGARPFRVAAAGIGLVPEDRAIFPDLTVAENLSVGAWGARRAGPWSAPEFLDMFPLLAARVRTPAGALSGGEQQLLTMCRSLLGQPRLLLVDEPTEGLAPMAVERVEALLREALRRGVAILLVEQKLTIALELADRVCVLGSGQVQFTGTPLEFADAHEVRRRWLEA